MYLCTDSNKPKIYELQSALERVIDWELLGLHLRLPYYEIQSIRMESYRSIDDCKLKLFDLWLRSDVDASWQIVIDALKEMRHNRLATIIQTKYCNK